MYDRLIFRRIVMDKSNKKIQESKKIIKEEKEKIKLEKRSLRNKKREKFRKTKVGKLLNRITTFFSVDRNNYSFSEVFAITLISLVIGVFACFSILTICTGGRNYFKLSKELFKFYDVYDTIVDNYYGEFTKEELVDSAISGMVASVGDEYTSYADSDTTEAFNEMVSGVYEGIGCTIQQLEDRIQIISVYEGGPADKAGLKEGDVIKKVDSYDAMETGSLKLSEYIKNEAEGKITMVIVRDDEEKTYVLSKGSVEVPTVSSKVYETNGKKVGYLNISLFSSVSFKQFKDKLEKLEDEGIDSLIIDVRDNNGGYLSSVTDIASYLLPRGKKIYQIQKNDDREVTKDKTLAKREYPIAILVNGNSASASEILAGVIKESYGGFVVGTKTYGKGTVQQVKNLSDGSMIKYTVENWLTPDGNWIDGVGIEPTDYVELSEEYINNPIEDNDNQLKKALELVSK